MNKDWPTKEQDMHAASVILDRYLESHSAEALNFLDAVYQTPKQMDQSISAPDWLIELTTYFVDRYGVTQGRVVTEKVLTKYLLAEQTIH